MKRYGNLYHLIGTYENLCLAFWKAARGKRDRADVTAFRRDFAGNIRALQDQLRRREPDIGKYRFFKVHDPKARDICAAAFPERVLHHALMNICEPALDAYAIDDSYACRKNKGNRRALARAQKFTRRFDWHLKLDIRRYFDSIDHAVALALLERRIKDRDVLRLFEQLLSTYHTAPGKGLPIGNLISQHLANFYLSGFDRWIKHECKVCGYLRYMDDFVLFGPDKAYLKAELALIEEYLDRRLKLRLKDNRQLNRCARGLPFLGYRVFPYRIRLAPRSRKRYIRRFIDYQQKWDDGEWSTDDLVRHLVPLVDFTKAAHAHGFRTEAERRFGAPS